MNGFTLVYAVEDACDGVHDEQNDDDGDWTHDFLKVISLRKQPDEREVLRGGFLCIRPR